MTGNDLWIIALLFGFILGLNPNTTSVFISLIAASIGKGHTKAWTASVALAYIETLLVFYTFFSAMVIWVLNGLSRYNMQNTGIVLGIILVGSGIYIITIAYLQGSRNYKKHLSPSLHKHTIKQVTVGSIISASILASIKSFMSTLLPLAGMSYILSYANKTLLWNMAVLPLAMLLPLAIISILALRKFRLSAIMKWKNDNAATFNTWSGVVCVLLGWFIWLLISKSVVIN